jgi:hypothetical protein
MILKKVNVGKQATFGELVGWKLKVSKKHLAQETTFFADLLLYLNTCAVPPRF